MHRRIGHILDGALVKRVERHGRRLLAELGRRRSKHRRQPHIEARHELVHLRFHLLEIGKRGLHRIFRLLGIELGEPHRPGLQHLIGIEPLLLRHGNELRRAGRPHGQELRDELLAIERVLHFHDLMAEIGAKLRRALQRRFHFRIGLLAEIIRRAEADLQLPVHRLGDIAHRLEHGLVAAVFRQREHHGAVPHAAAHAILHADIARHGTPAKVHPAPAGFQAEDAAAGRRNADRPAAIRRMRHRQHARGDRRRRAAGRPARRMIEAPGIMRRAEQQRFRCRQQAEFRRVGLAQNDEPRLVGISRHRRIVLGNGLRHQAGAMRRAHALHIVEILDEIGNAGKRALGQSALRCLLARRIERLGHHRIHLGVHRLDPVDRRVHQFQRGRLALGNELGLRDGVETGRLRGKCGTDLHARHAHRKRADRCRREEPAPRKLNAHDVPPLNP